MLLLTKDYLNELYDPAVFKISTTSSIIITTILLQQQLLLLHINTTITATISDRCNKAN